MEYDAITLDTSAFHRNGLHPERGLLSKLSQFKEGSAQFVLSEVVVRELKVHLEKEAKDALDRLRGAVRDLEKCVLLRDEQRTKMDHLERELPSPSDSVNNRLNQFVADTRATIVPADLVGMKELIKHYFGPLAPFESSEKKKSEFPDAIALLSLEHWATVEKKKILAVSADRGWAAFGKKSDWIDVVEDLASALEKFQQHAADAEAWLSNFLHQLDSGNLSEPLQQITDRIADGVSDLNVAAEGSSAFYFEAEPVELSYQDFRFLIANEQYDFHIVQTGKDKIVAKIGVAISAKATCEFSFSSYDSIDGDYVPIGNSFETREIQFEAAVLVTFEGEFREDPAVIEVAETEIVDAIDEVNFGDVEPDYDDYDDDQDVNDDQEAGESATEAWDEPGDNEH